MIKTTITLQGLRRRIYLKAKADPSHRFWGMYVHVCKEVTLQQAYKHVKLNRGSAGIDGQSFEQIEQAGVDQFLEEIRKELVTETFYPQRNRIKEIPKDGGRVRRLGIPTIRDRVVQCALKLILEPVFEADFQEGSYGYRPKRTAHEAIERVSQAIVREHIRVIDLDLKSYFDTIRHDLLLKKVAERIADNSIMRLLRRILKAGGKRGVPQGGVISPLLSNLYLNEVDKMLEKAKQVTRKGRYTYLEYARFADDLVILVDRYRKWDWLYIGVKKRLKEELTKVGVEINRDKTKEVDLARGETFSFLGFDYRLITSSRGNRIPLTTPRGSSRTKLLRRLKEVFRRYRSQPVESVISEVNPIVRGWVNYYRIGNSAECFGYVNDWLIKKVRRHMMKARGRKGFGWKRWSRTLIYNDLGLYNDYKIKYHRSQKARPAQYVHK